MDSDPNALTSQNLGVNLLCDPGLSRRHVEGSLGKLVDECHPPLEALRPEEPT